MNTSETWTVPEIRVKRMKREEVKVRDLNQVDGVFIRYQSVFKAFESLRLDVSKHVAFRGLMKIAKEHGRVYNETLPSGKKVSYLFIVVEKEI